MTLNIDPCKVIPAIELGELGAFIAGVQKENGEIPWSVGGKTDPWDHVESAMGLTVAGLYGEALRAYDWMAATQNLDGSWNSAWRDGRVEDGTKESNFAAYPAVGVFHYYLITRDDVFLRRMWPTVSAGIEFALSLQAQTGEIYWATNQAGVIDRMALLTGSCSIYMSLKCALALAAILGEKKPSWQAALDKLRHAIQHLPHHFNMIKSRFSMDWYYPILCGVVTAAEARNRIDRGWEKFAVAGWGIRCVSDQPWVTMAETAELVLSLAAIDAYDEAETVFNWLLDKRYDDGAYWMGVTFPDRVVWPDEKTSWTAAAVILAYDALNGLTPGSRLFHHGAWNGSGKEPGAERFATLHR